MNHMSSLPSVELGVLGPLQVRQDGAPVSIPGSKPRAILSMLGLRNGSVVPADTLIELLWSDDPPRTAAKALQTHISALRRALGDGVVVTEGTGWALHGPEVDASRYKMAAKMGREAAAAGDTSQALARFEEALTLWRGIPELPDGHRGLSEKTRWLEGHAALVEDRADALLATGRAAEVIGDLEAAVAEAPLRERRWGQLMLALYRAGRQGEALGAFQRARSHLAEELGVDPGPELRRLEAAVVAQDASLDVLVAQQLSSVTRAVTFLLTDIEGSTAAWEADADAMAVALARHDEIAEQVVTSRGGRLIKTRGEGDATFSVFDRPSAAAAAALELQDAITHEPWALGEPMRIRIALHTGEVELRDGDYFGRAVNRAARLRSLADGGQILCSGATAELVIDSLSDDVLLTDLGMRQLKNLARPEHVFELRRETGEDGPPPQTGAEPMARPDLPAVLIGPGPFVGRGDELERLLSTWRTVLAGGVCPVLIAGEPGVGKTRLAGEWSQQAYAQGAAVLYGRCDEDLGAPYQPFAEALRSLVPCVGPDRLRGLRGVEALLPLVPRLTDVLPDLAAPTSADPDTERYALFDAVVAVFEIGSAGAPLVLVLDDLHWAAKPTLLLLRHLLRFGDHTRMQIVGTYRNTDLDRSHPLAAMLADLHRDGTANRISLSGLDDDDVTTYVAEAGYDDAELAHALASVTGGNPFFLIEALRHVDESGGVWDQSTLPQGVREAVSRRLSRLPVETNKALAAAAVVGSRFAVELVESVVGNDLIDAFDEASKAGIVIEEPGGHYRFNHAIVRQSLLAELASVRRMRLHQRIATTLESQPGADDELLAELAHHYFECAWAGNAAKAVLYCRRAADQAMARLAYEGAADLYDHALHALEEIDEELPDRDDQAAELLIARCEALLAAGDVASAAGAVSQLQAATGHSARLAAWATCFDGQLSMLTHPERLGEVEAALGAAAEELARLDDAAGEAKAHTVRAASLARLGRIGDCEVALDDALTAARRAREHRRVNAVLAGAPLAALWGPNPVARAGGRCLDVVRLLRITTDSPAVEATSTRCQAVLEAFRGRAAPARRMIDSARRTVTELGLRHALLEVEQFAGIVELVLDDPAAAEPHLRKAYNGFRRMGLDADTAETAALLGLTCLALDQDTDADELCTESERLAGHALKPSIAWRTLRAQLLSRRGDHGEARRVAQAAMALAERTDLLIDHGDACLALATILESAGDAAGARAAAEQAAALYERKGAAALAEKARRILGGRVLPVAPAPPEAPAVKLNNACARAIGRLDSAVDRGAWDEVEELIAPVISHENRRKIVGYPRDNLAASEWVRLGRLARDIGPMQHHHVVVAVRGQRVALARLEVGTADVSPAAPQDEMLEILGLDKEGRIALQMWFDIDDMDAAHAELDAAHARLGEPSRASLENAASRVYGRLQMSFAARDWDAMAAMLADNSSMDDRRPVVGAGVRRGRDATMAGWRAIAEIGATDVTSVAIATRGTHLALCRTWAGTSGAFDVEALQIVDIDADEHMVALVSFGLDDFASALADLDARYLAGEAGAHAQTWSAISGAFGAINRHELPERTPDWINLDRRRGAAFGTGEMTAYLHELLDDTPDMNVYIEVVHRLSNLGAVVTQVGQGTSQQGFQAEWRETGIYTFDGDLLSHCELFDDGDLDAAIARFEELSPQVRRLENAASRANSRCIACFNARDWDTMASILADDHYSDDRRPVTGTGTRRGRDADIENFRAIADLGANITVEVIATRGDRLILTRTRFSFDQHQQGFVGEALILVETGLDGRIAATVMLDLEDIDAAFEELDARYLAGEAAGYTRTWSAIAAGYAGFNRRELLATTPDWVNIDHRRGAAFASGDMIAYIHAAWDDSPDTKIYVAAVHRLSKIGAVVTHLARGISQEGFDAEWRDVHVLAVEDDVFSRSELFDEVDLNAAIARFGELHPQPSRLGNAASLAYQRLRAHFEARDWEAMTAMLASDAISEDRRRAANAGSRPGPDAAMQDARAMTDLGVTRVTSRVIAIRGGRLVLMHARYLGPDGGAAAFHTEVLSLVEIGTDDRIVTRVWFDPDDFDAAIAELDARYLAGEAAAHARTWSAITGGHAALNRHELPPTTPDCVSIDHRRGAPFAPGELIAYFRAGWDLNQDIRTYVEVVHRLTDLGAVCTHVAHGVSHEGFDAEWRGVDLLTVEGDMVNRCEAFDEVDLNVAIAAFEELGALTPGLENAASRVLACFQAHFAAGDWDAMAEVLADNYSSDDRRRVVGAGVRHGPDAQIADMRAIAGLWTTNTASTVVATRGERLVLFRFAFSDHHHGPEAFLTEVLGIGEINADERIVAVVSFDVDDIDAAFEELDARYLADEAAAHSHAWSAITQAYAVLNRGEIPTTAINMAEIDHRPLAPIASGDLKAYLRATFEDSAHNILYVETVHRLTNLGAVVTNVAKGTSREGFYAEWRMVLLMTADAGLVNRGEVFEEADLDLALARFEELHPQTPRLENAASQAYDRLQACFAARDWDAMAEMLASDAVNDDRRRVVGAGLREGHGAVIAEMSALAEIGVKRIASDSIATRGRHLVLSRSHAAGHDQRPDAFRTDVLNIVQIDADERIVALLIFEPEDFDAAIAELDTRYLAGEGAAHSHPWLAITQACAALNRGEVPATTPEFVDIDHRSSTPIGPGDLVAYLNEAVKDSLESRVYVEAVHRITDRGAVITHTAIGTSREGLEAEWRMVDVFTVEGDLLSHHEIFDEADLDAALARSDDLHPTA
jgi:DNA-binding SARP family transcriptional activator